MTKVVFYESDGLLVGLHVSGHTGYSEEGTDIVCAAVSALTQTAIAALEDIAGCDLDESYIGDALLSAKLSLSNDIVAKEKADLILRTQRLGLCSIAKDYGKYLNIFTEEV